MKEKNPLLSLYQSWQKYPFLLFLFYALCLFTTDSSLSFSLTENRIAIIRKPPKYFISNFLLSSLLDSDEWSITDMQIILLFCYFTILFTKKLE